MEQATYKQLFQQLAQRGVKSITVYYHGEGDEGGIYDLEVRPEAKKGEIKEQEDEAVRDLLLRLLGEKYPGWEINEGSEGSLTINLHQKRAELELNHYNVILDHEHCQNALGLSYDDG